MSSPAIRFSLVALALALGPAARGEPPARTDLYGDPLPPGAISRLGTVRWRAQYGVSRMAFVPGGKYLATTSGLALSVWDVETGRVVRTISTDGTPEGVGFTYDFTFSRDGKRLLSTEDMGSPTPGGWGGPGRKPVLLLWDYSSRKLLAQSPDLEGPPGHLALRNDGRLAACAIHLGDVFVWEVGKNVVRRVAEGDRRVGVHSLAFAAEGKHLVVLPCEGGVAQRIDVASGELLKQVELGPCGRVALAPGDGTIATYSYPDRLYLHDTSSGEKRRLPLKEKVDYLDLSFSPDGRTLLALDRYAEVVQFWDVAKEQLLRRLRVPGMSWSDGHAELLLSGDGKRLASYEEHRVVRISDARTGRPLLRFPGHVRPPGQLAFSPDGKEVVSHAHRDRSRGGQLFRWAAATGKLLTRVVPDAPEEGWPGSTQDWLLAPGGGHLAERVGKAIYLYEGNTGKRLVLTDKAPPNLDWTFTPDGRALVTTSADQEVRLWDVTRGKLLRRLALEKKGGPISWLRFTPDGNTLVTGERWQKVHLWDAATGKHRATFTLPAEREPSQKPLDKWQTAFTPDGRYLFASNTTNLWVWDLVARREIGLFEGDKYEWSVTGSGQVAVSPDGRLLAWFDEAWKLRLYEVCTGRIVHRFKEAYSSVAFAPSGWRLATGCEAEASILVWDLPLLFRSQPLDKETGPESLWAALAGDDAVLAHRAVWRLAALPEADDFLSRHLQPVEAPSPQQLRALLADLKSPEFATRQKAEQGLAAAGEAVCTALTEAASTKDAEMRRRLARLQARLQPRAPERLRELRAVLALEARGTPETRRLLEQLAGGAPEARLTQEAKAALRRWRGTGSVRQ